MRGGLTALVVAAIITACGGVGDIGLPGRAVPLDNTEWMLVSLNGESLIEGSAISLRFEEGVLSGFAGCNGYGGGPDSGGYHATGTGGLTIPQLAVKLRICQWPEGVMQQEASYVAALTNAAAYRSTEDRLEIHNAGGETTLVFARRGEFEVDPSDLMGTEWQLLSMGGRSPLEGSSITLAFAEGEISGQAGCRGYRGTYEASGDDIRFPFLEMTELSCSGPEAMLLQEAEYTTRLEWVNHFLLIEGRLHLFTAQSEVLIYDPVGTAIGRS